uniref:Uncharacterized protein n=1 Tax=Arundo donax TaxID=35708 RepID=A0A0A8Z8Q8_ARUDO
MKNESLSIPSKSFVA